MEALDEIKQNLKLEKLILGKDRVIKELKSGNLTKIFTTVNITEEALSDLKHFAGLSGAEIISLDIDNEELGIICKRSHVVSVVGLMK